jgi:hypothetical protein
MYCVKCGVQLEDTEKSCPLCGTRCYHPDIDRPAAEPLYPQEQYPAPQVRSKGLVTILTWLFALPAFVTVLCDLRINYTVTWSGYVATSLAMVYIMLVLPFWFRKPNPVVFVPVGFAALAGFLFYLDMTIVGQWFLTFALPLVGALCVIFTALVTLLKYVKKGKLFIYGGCLIALGAVMPVMEMLMNYTFHRKFVAWSVYPFAALVGVGLYLIFLGIYRPAREIMERKFFI